MPWVKVDGWCTEKFCPGVTPQYNPAKSATFSLQKDTKEESAAYGTGDLKGHKAFDNFCLNDHQAGVCFRNYFLNFIGAQESSSAFSEFQGVIGLGPTQIDSVNLFLNQEERNGLDAKFSVFYCLDE